MIPTPRALTMAWPVQSALSQIHCALAGAPASPEPLRIVTVSANQYAQCLLLPIVLTLLGRIKKEIQLEMIDAAAPQASATPTADLTIEWSSRKQEAQNPPVVLLRDAWVGVIGRRNSRLRGIALRESLDRLMRSRQAEGAVFLSNGAALPSHHTADALGAMSVVSSSDAVAVVPRRLAARFARPFGLKILTKPGASDECVLSLSTRGGLDASVNGALQVVINSFVGAGKTLSRSRKA
jgi:DNA-binding transcriptional LysR family regulator